MAEADNQPDDAAKTKADALALAEQAEAEAAQAEALAAAARARARAVRLRRQAEAEAESAQTAAATTPTETAAATPESADLTSEARQATRSDEPAVAPAEPARRWRPRLRVTTVLAVVAVVGICGLLAASGYMIWYHHTAVEQRQRAATFAAAARQGVINMLSMDFKKAKEDVQRVIDNSTGEFKDDFQKRAADFTTVVEQSKAVTEGAVTTTGVESMGKDSAVVLVLGTERVTNAAGAKDEPRVFRLRVSVAREGDQIKLSKVEFVL